MAERNTRTGSHSHYRRKKRSTGKIALGVVIAIIVIFLAVILLLGIKASGLDTIYPNVTVGGIEVGKLTVEEAADKLEKEYAGDSRTLKVILTDAVSLDLTSEDMGLCVDPQEGAELAYAYGRDGGFVKNAFRYLGCLFGKQEIALTEGSFDEASVRAVISDGAKQANTQLLSSVYEITATDVIIHKGESGIAVNEDAVFALVKAAIEKEEYSTIYYEPETVEAETIDLQMIYDQIYCEPVASIYDAATQDASPSTNGLSFDIAEAQKLYETAADGEVVTIPLIVTEASPTQEALREMLFRDVLSEKTTSLSSSSANRINNVSLAAQACNVILNPGEQFSFNGSVGERTAAKGFKEAGAYVAGESVDQIGGGICQCSSTIYYCALMADLQIDERSNHMYPVSYLPMGLDATVNWGSLDFKFTNNTDYPIKIVAGVANKKLSVSILGTKTNGNYVKLDSVVISSTAPETVYEVDETFVKGQTEEKTKGHTGYVVEAYMYRYDENDNLIEKVFLSKNKYRVQNKVILISPYDVEGAEQPPEEQKPVDPTPVEPTPAEPTPTEPTPEEPIEEEPVVTNPTDGPGV